MKLNPEILEAIRKAVEYYGNTSQFAKEAGITHSTVHFWLSGKTTNISNQVWDKRVRKILRQFMPESESRFRNALHENGKTPLLPKDADPDQKNVKKVPALLFSRMNQFDSTIQSPVSFACKNMIAEIHFANPCSSQSCGLVLDDEQYCPQLPLGTRILISGSEYAENGNVVIGKTRGVRPELFFCRLYRDGEQTRLVPFNPKLPEMSWKTDDNAENVFWIFPVKEISINLENSVWEGNSLIGKEPHPAEQK